VFTINFFHRHFTFDHSNYTNGRFCQEGFPFQNIKTRHIIKHSEVGQKHLTKTITHSWRVGEKIMKLSKQVLSKDETMNASVLWDIVSRAKIECHEAWFTCTRCSSVFQQV